MTAEPDAAEREALGAALAETPQHIRVVHLSREELEQQKETLLGLLQVFELYTRSDLEDQLAEVEYLLGKGDPS